MADQTAGDLIYASLRKAGVTLGPGRTPSPAQSKDALDELRRLTASLNCDRLFIYTERANVFPILASKSGYTWGQVSGTPSDFDAPWPQMITRANYLDAPGSMTPYPLTIHTPQTWASIGSRTMSAGIPEGLYTDRAHPVSNIYFDPWPRAGGSVEIWAWHQVPTYTTEGDIVVMPPQYEDALVLNLACRLGPQFQRPVDPDLRQQARESLMRLESINAPQPIAGTGGLGCGGGYDIYSDQ